MVVDGDILLPIAGSHDGFVPGVHVTQAAVGRIILVQVGTAEKLRVKLQLEQVRASMVVAVAKYIFPWNSRIEVWTLPAASKGSAGNLE